MEGTPKLSTLVASGAGSQIEYRIYVENGKVIYETENDGHAYMRRGPEESREEITLDDLKHGRVRGGQHYEAVAAEVARQLAILKEHK